MGEDRKEGGEPMGRVSVAEWREREREGQGTSIENERERERFALGGKEMRRKEELENGPSCVLLIVIVSRARRESGDCDLFSLFVIEREPWKCSADLPR